MFGTENCSWFHFTLNINRAIRLNIATLSKTMNDCWGSCWFIFIVCQFYAECYFCFLWVVLFSGICPHANATGLFSCWKTWMWQRQMFSLRNDQLVSGVLLTCTIRDRRIHCFVFLIDLFTSFNGADLTVLKLVFHGLQFANNQLILLIAFFKLTYKTLCRRNCR